MTTLREVLASAYDVPQDWIPDSMEDGVRQLETAQGDRRKFLKSYVLMGQYAARMGKVDGNKLRLVARVAKEWAETFNFADMESRLLAAYSDADAETVRRLGGFRKRVDDGTVLATGSSRFADSIPTTEALRVPGVVVVQTDRERGVLTLKELLQSEEALRLAVGDGPFYQAMVCRPDAVVAEMASRATDSPTGSVCNPAGLVVLPTDKCPEGWAIACVSVEQAKRLRDAMEYMDADAINEIIAGAGPDKTRWIRAEEDIECQTPKPEVSPSNQ